MAAPVVFDGVWKKFRRGERHDSLRDLLPSLGRRIVRPRDLRDLKDEEFWALRDVSFEACQGEAVGIIGPNGAGKSTALKLLSRILKPTRGYCRVEGRLGALIEVAAGFHPDLTGRENVFLQGAIMGMRRAEISTRFDEIVDFAGIGPFIDTPIKRYSSGMNARLGFSIAAHLSPDVLLIDEVLSVGDVPFQQRCVSRMNEFKRRGTAIIFVSHNLQAIASLCETSVYLAGGVRMMGPTPEVVARYIRDVSVHPTDTSTGVDIVSATLRNSRGRVVDTAMPGTPLRLRATYRASKALSDWHVGFLVYRSTDGLMVYARSVDAAELRVPILESGDELTVDFEFTSHLTRGQYHFEVHMFDNGAYRHVARKVPAAVLRIDERESYGGVADLDFACHVVRAPVSAGLLRAVAGRPS